MTSGFWEQGLGLWFWDYHFGIRVLGLGAKGLGLKLEIGIKSLEISYLKIKGLRLGFYGLKLWV